VRDLFGDRVDSLELTRREYVERAADPGEYVALFKTTFGPVIGLYSLLAGQPERAAQLDADVVEFATGENQGAPDGPAEYRYGYLLVAAARPNASSSARSGPLRGAGSVQRRAAAAQRASRRHRRRITSGSCP
jgi:hypothetical protein